MTTADAYTRCQAIAAAHYENFPVASWLLPSRMRPHVAAVYAFARAADDFADEGDAPASQRLEWLATWRDLRATGPGAARSAPAVGRVPADDVRATFVATHDTIARCQLDPTLFDDLLSAFAQDVTTTRYATWADVLDYCRRSANPVGRLVLGIAGVRNETAAQQSDAICTALQLTNFWQDLGRDWLERDRLYVPEEVLGRHGASVEALSSSSAQSGSMRRASSTPAEWRSVMDDLGARTRQLFDHGRPVSEAVRGRLRYELRATWLGGTTVLARTLEVRARSLHERPTLSKLDMLRIAIRAIRA